MRAEAQMFLVFQQDDCIAGFAKLPRTLDNLFQNRFDIGGRRGDDPQNIAAPGLVSQRLLGLVEQPHIVDREHGLTGKGLDQRYLMWIECLGVRMCGADRTYDLVFMDHGREHDRVESEVVREPTRSFRGAQVVPRHKLPCLLAKHDQATDRGVIERTGETFGQLLEPRLAADGRHGHTPVAQQLDSSELRAEQPQQTGHDSVEHRLYVGR